MRLLGVLSIWEKFLDWWLCFWADSESKKRLASYFQKISREKGASWNRFLTLSNRFWAIFLRILSFFHLSNWHNSRSKLKFFVNPWEVQILHPNELPDILKFKRSPQKSLENQSSSSRTTRSQVSLHWPLHRPSIPQKKSFRLQSPINKSLSLLNYHSRATWLLTFSNHTRKNWFRHSSNKPTTKRNYKIKQKINLVSFTIDNFFWTLINQPFSEIKIPLNGNRAMQLSEQLREKIVCVAYSICIWCVVKSTWHTLSAIWERGL